MESKNLGEPEGNTISEDLNKEMREMEEDIKVKNSEPSLIEKYISLFVIQMAILKKDIRDPFYILELNTNELADLYSKNINKICCHSKEEYIQNSKDSNIKDTVKTLYTDQDNKTKDEDYIIIVLEGKVDKLIFNPYHLFVGIRHDWTIETENIETENTETENIEKEENVESQGNKTTGTVFLSMMEKSIFIDAGLKVSFYKVLDKYEPFIMEKKVRDRIICEILMDLYENGVLNKEMEKKIVVLDFYGDKHLINTWKRGIRMAPFLSIKNLEEFSEEVFYDNISKVFNSKTDGEHIFITNFKNPETKDIMLFTWFKQSYDILSSFYTSL